LSEAKSGNGLANSHRRSRVSLRSTRATALRTGKNARFRKIPCYWPVYPHFSVHLYRSFNSLQGNSLLGMEQGISGTGIGKILRWDRPFPATNGSAPDAMVKRTLRPPTPRPGLVGWVERSDFGPQRQKAPDIFYVAKQRKLKTVTNSIIGLFVNSSTSGFLIVVSTRVVRVR